MSALLLGAVAIGIAAVVGGMSGFAASLLATPALLLIGYEVSAVVVVNLTVTVVTRLVVAIRSRAEIRGEQVWLLMCGSAPGAVLGALTVGLLPPEVLRITAGVVVVLLGIQLLLPVRGVRPIGRTEHVATGALSGYLSTTTSLNGAPVAALLGRCRLPVSAFLATLACYFVITNLLSLGILAVVRFSDLPHLWPALPVLVVAGLVGNAVGTRISTKLSAHAFARIVAALVIASGLATVFT